MFKYLMSGGTKNKETYRHISAGRYAETHAERVYSASAIKRLVTFWLCFGHEY
jgi:hypothetical protein